ncbi:MAG: electron transfer flavoprotein subunit beta/FixA family protein [bacterium]
MNIAVCIKQVPSTETRIRVSTQTGFVDTSDAEWVINPYDEYALETALRLKEQLGAATITAVSLGPDRAKAALKTALATGADSAVHLWDAAFEGLDALGTGRALAVAVKRAPFDLVLCGKQAIDDDMAAVPQAVAHFLGIPHVAVVAEAHFEGTNVTAHREVEGATEVVELGLPCLLTIQKGKFEPRLPTLKGMMAAKKKEIPTLGAADLGLDASALTRGLLPVGDRLPPGRKPGRVIEGDPGAAVNELVRVLREEAKVV